MHRWTATALARLHPEAVKDAHRKAARFWRWRVEVIPQSREQDIDQLVEARYHHHAASELDDAVEATESVANQLHTWGQYSREAELCREALAWVPMGSQKAAVFTGQLGLIAQDRSDYGNAEARYHEALQIFERLDDQAGMATIYQQLGELAQDRGDYDTAERCYRQSGEISERLGDQAGMATCYYRLGMLAHHPGDYDIAEARYQQALQIFERLGNQAGMATAYGQLGLLREQTGAHQDAVLYQIRALRIRLQLGTPDAEWNLRRVAELRAALGLGEFLATVRQHLDEDAAPRLMTWLDQAEQDDGG